VIDGRKVLAVVPARGGSKGVPDKNIRMLGNKPLIAWTLQAATKSRYIDTCIVSTDSAKIAEIAVQWGGKVPFLRPAELAQDNTPGIEPVLHALQNLPGYDLVVLLQPTSPFRITDDIDGCIEKLVDSKASSCVSVAMAHPSPYWMYTIQSNGRMQPLLETQQQYLTRQSLPEVYVLNGAVYVAEQESLQKNRSFLHSDTAAYIMPSERSLDIDTMHDFELAEMQIHRLN